MFLECGDAFAFGRRFQIRAPKNVERAPGMQPNSKAAAGIRGAAALHGRGLRDDPAD